MDDQYYVYITGKTVHGFDLALSQTLFGQRFKLTADKVKRLFSLPMPLMIKRKVDTKTAQQFKQILFDMGLEGYIETTAEPNIDASTLSLVPYGAEAYSSSPGAATVTCPKCGLEQYRSAECVSCEIVFDDYIVFQHTLGKGQIWPVKTSVNRGKSSTLNYSRRKNHKRFPMRRISSVLVTVTILFFIFLEYFQLPDLIG